MTIRRLVQVLFGTLLVLALAESAMIITAAVRRAQLVRLEEKRFRSYQLADMLRQSSDELTRFARTYVATGDEKYERFYRQVLAIRNGEAPRPVHYEGAYWDLTIDGASRAAGPPASLRSLMEAAGFTPLELARLGDSESRSNRLVAIEETAIHAMKGEFRDAAGGFTRRGRPDQAMAIRIMHDSSYHRAKATIMAPIDEFLRMVQDRTATELATFERDTRMLLRILGGILVLFLISAIAAYPILRARVLVPVTALQRQTRAVAADIDRLATVATQNASGNRRESFGVRTAPIGSTRPDEVGDLSRLHDSMLTRLDETGGAITRLSAALAQRAEEAVAQFEVIFRESPIALSVSELESGKFVAVNRAFLDLGGAGSYEQIVGRTSLELGIWEGGTDERRTSLGQLGDSERRSMMRDFRTLDGTLRRLDVTTTQYEVGGRRLVLAACVDITDRLKADADRANLQEQLQQSQKMDAIGRLAGGIAHDFNNLLTVIIGSGEMALSSMNASTQEAADVAEMVKAGNRAAQMTRQLLAFSRRQVIEPRDVNLNEVLKNIEKMLRRMIGDDVRLDTTLAPDVDTILADPGQLEQVIANLAINARDAMPTGGSLTMTTSRVVLKGDENPAAKAGRYVQLRVRDTGSGMTDEVRKRIFEPFFTTKEVGKGTGLGLSTVFGIVQQNGGFIDVTSEVGKGTVFDLYFPRSVPTRASSQVQQAPASLAGTETVLVAEDNEALRSLAVRMLREHGYTVLTAAGGADALDLAERYDGPIDLLIADVVMPGTNGRALADGLARARPNLRVLYMSGYTDDVLGRHGVLETGVHLLAKPFTATTLGAKVREVLAS